MNLDQNTQSSISTTTSTAPRPPIFYINSISDLDSLHTLHWHVDYDLTEHPSLLGFIRRWRIHFVETMKP